MILPAFDGHGNLPAGDYWPTSQDFEERFVRLQASATRLAIYLGWGRHRKDLAACGLVQTAAILLNGSYTTSKVDPGDLDLAVEVPISDSSDMCGPMAPVFNLLQGPAMKPPYQCDAYPIPVLPASHPAHVAVTQAARAYWNKWFGTDRSGNAKGRVWATLGGLR